MAERCKTIIPDWLALQPARTGEGVVASVGERDWVDRNEPGMTY